MQFIELSHVEIFEDIEKKVVKLDFMLTYVSQKDKKSHKF